MASQEVEFICDGEVTASFGFLYFKAVCITIATRLKLLGSQCDCLLTFCGRIILGRCQRWLFEKSSSEDKGELNEDTPCVKKSPICLADDLINPSIRRQYGQPYSSYRLKQGWI